jgi:hypothetical protein
MAAIPEMARYPNVWPFNRWGYEFRRYDGEGHNIEQPKNIRDYWMSMIRFFDARLKATDTFAVRVTRGGSSTLVARHRAIKR